MHPQKALTTLESEYEVFVTQLEKACTLKPRVALMILGDFNVTSWPRYESCYARKGWAFLVSL